MTAHTPRPQRIAQLRAAYPTWTDEEILAYIHDEEVEQEEAAEGRRILAQTEGGES